MFILQQLAALFITANIHNYRKSPKERGQKVLGQKSYIVVNTKKSSLWLIKFCP